MEDISRPFGKLEGQMESLMQEHKEFRVEVKDRLFSLETKIDTLTNEQNILKLKVASWSSAVSVMVMLCFEWVKSKVNFF